jgi:aspartyl/asparaginyl beta-hydroxylase (cupin superfamily)
LKPFTYNHEAQKPHLFYVPDLRAVPFWSLREFSWANELKAQYQLIAEEFHSIQTSDEVHTRPYLDKYFGANTDLEGVAGQSSWTALDLYKDGKCSPFAKKYFPKTLKALEALPLSGRGDRPDEVFFSILQPGQEIPPHYGLSNHSLTVHLGIDIPGGELTVAGENYCWKEAEIVVFDDSFLHSARNDSEKVRVVLLFSIWHPDLSDKEILAIKRAFNYRQTWLEQRCVAS